MPAIGRSTGQQLIRATSSSTTQTENIKYWELCIVNESAVSTTSGWVVIQPRNSGRFPVSLHILVQETLGREM